MDQLVQHQQTINDQLARYGVKFGLYKNGTFQERLFALCWFYYKNINSTCQRFPAEKQDFTQSSGRAVKPAPFISRTFCGNWLL